MKKVYNLLWVGALAFILGGCDEKLDIEPRQSISTDIALSSGENIKNILIGTYEETSQSASYGGFLQMMADLYGFEDQATWGGTFQQPRQIFNKAIFVDNSFVSALWLNAYESINQANLVIDYADIIEDETERNTAVGEAYFLRALNYFDINRFFTSPDGSLGVPLSLEGITDYSQNLEIPRASSDAVYQQVISDLENAYELLPESNSFFADKYAAQALLARVQLHVGNYPAAAEAANDVIENSGHSLTGTYADAFNNDVDSSEDIFAFQVTSQGGDNELVVHYADQRFGGRGGDITVNPEYLALFGDTDDRGSFFYISAQNGGTLTEKYTNQFANVSILRLAEMYLIRAEANLREGSAIGATPLEDVNTVRARSNAELLSDVTVDDILLERELELMFEGHLIFDYTRTGRAVDGIPADSDRLSFPIPLREMDVNSELVQNPGYGS
ncbi:RagB/SusD family nutrient uptake outer membrane protein [Gramella sp. GC03-9]|uniref:RagB/SusD family nutrient uptake outer membrane protein n=1 Tax=Christiangramia oceanisediminis TaxID=2920386 RepID=A0A9X2I8C8_9FLAO|nr:RagB/SusD family nutrient uptake outer membrane protein [Gramella oceanisediminis]MCP9199704.1 RagB/SusD family nutrient uptake outer membrane protein [Gramella oceanisediminis]